MLASYLAAAFTIIAPALVGQTASNKIITGEVTEVSRYEVTVKGKMETVTLSVTSETEITIDRKGAGREKLAKGQVGTVLYDVVELEAKSLKLTSPEEIARREAEEKKEEMEADKAAKDMAAVKEKIAAQRAKEEAEEKAAAAKILGRKAFYRKIANQSALGMELPTQEDCTVVDNLKVARDLQNAAIISKAEYEDKLRMLSQDKLSRSIPKGTMLRVIETSGLPRGYSSNNPLPLVVKCRIIDSSVGPDDRGREVWLIADAIIPTLGDSELLDIAGSTKDSKTDPRVPKSKSGKVSFFGIDADGGTPSDEVPDPKAKTVKKKRR